MFITQKLFLLLRVCVCVCVCVVSQFDLSITKQNYPKTLYAMFKSAITRVELDDWGKYDRTTDGGN